MTISWRPSQETEARQLDYDRQQVRESDFVSHKNKSDKTIGLSSFINQFFQS